MKTKSLLSAGLLLLVAALPAVLTAEDEAKQEKSVWLTNLQEARKISTETGKPILADFTGSDWCPPCKALKKDVLSSEEFLKWAKENVVLLELDFPRKIEQPADLKAQNQALQKTFKITGYPTLLFMDAKGKELGRLVGYRPLDKWMAEAKGILEKKS